MKKLLCSITGLLILVCGAHAQQAINVVTPYPAGGGLDVLARLVTQKMTEQSSEVFFVDNKAGANGSIGSKFVAQSKPDGKTFLFGVDVVTTVNPFLYPKDPGYSPEKDLRILCGVASQATVLVVHPDFKARTVKAFVAYAKQQGLTYGSGGIGSAAHLAMEFLSAETGGLKLTHVPYKGAPPALMDQLAGRLDASFVTLPAALPYIKSGKLVALAVASPQRVSLLPNVPTMIEQGYRGFEVETIAMVMVPSKMSIEISSRIEKMVVQALADPSLQEQINAVGWEPKPAMTGVMATAWADEARARWGKLIKDKGIKTE